MNQQKIGNFLKQLRNEKGITQEQAAEQFSVSQRTISRWETGSNMPDIGMLIEIAEFYHADVREIIDGERKSEDMNHETKETLEKIANYNEAIHAREMKAGILSMAALFIVLVLISTVKNISAAPLVSLMCAYNGASFLSKAKRTKDKLDVISGALFLGATILNTIVFILR